MKIRNSSISVVLLFGIGSVVAMFSLLVGGPTSASSQADDDDLVRKPALAFPRIQLQALPGSLTVPVHISHAGDGSGRLFVVEQEGLIHLYKNGNLLDQPFLDIHTRVHMSGEQGLLSVAFPPGYAAKGYFYVYYTNLNQFNLVSRFHISANPDRADAGSEEIILSINHQLHENHDGGQMAFGPDGYLYIGTGDGGGGGDPEGNGQDRGSLLGKILRIDVEPQGAPHFQGMNMIFLPFAIGSGGGLPYRIPTDNPFINTPGARGEIWAWGMRNPWRFSFDRTTGDLYIADVGQDRYEEIDFQPAASPGGENYGWNIMEGMHCYIGNTCNQAGLTLPVQEYTHGLGCSVTGGFVYRGPGNAGMQGYYFYGDYCSGRIWAAIRQSGNWSSQEVLNSPYSISTFGEDQAGNIYLADRAAAKVYQVVEAP